MDLDPKHLLELVGLETLIAAFVVGSIVSMIYLRTRSSPISLGLIGQTRAD